MAAMPPEVLALQEAQRSISDTVDAVLEARDQIRVALDKVIAAAEGQEQGVTLSKGLSAAAAVTSSVLLFTPLVVVGGIGLAASAAVQVGTTVADLVLTTMATNQMQALLDADKDRCEWVAALVEEFDARSAAVAALVAARVFIAEAVIRATPDVVAPDDIGGEAALLHAPQPEDLALQGSAALGRGLVANAASGASGFAKAGVALGRTGLTAGRTATAATRGAAAATRTAAATSTALLVGRTLGVVGAVVSVADLVWSLSQENATVAQVRAVQEKMAESSAMLQELQTNAVVQTVKSTLQAVDLPPTDGMEPGGLVVLVGDATLRRLLPGEPDGSDGNPVLAAYMNERRRAALYAPLPRTAALAEVLRLLAALLPDLEEAFDPIRVCVCTGKTDLERIFFDRQHNWRETDPEAAVARLLREYATAMEAFPAVWLSFVYGHNPVYDEFVCGALRCPPPTAPRPGYRTAVEQFLAGLGALGVEVFRPPVDAAEAAAGGTDLLAGHLGPASEARFAQWLIDRHLQ